MLASEPVIYLVEDDPAVRDSLRLLLEMQQFGVAEYGTGRSFLDDYGSRAQVPGGCLILDLDLPDMSGLDLIRALSADGCRLPVIVITGRNVRGMREQIGREGVAAFLEKPFPEERLLSLIREVVARA